MAIEKIDTPPTVTEADRRYAGVYQELDGQWQGIFTIYQDTLGQRPMDPSATKPDSAFFASLPLRAIQSVRVQQFYTSETPFFQRVEITDRYESDDGQVHTVHSRGVNKVQNGQMWCVVVKPGETVVHRGSTEGDHTIVWQRDLRDPLRIEYFREQVSRQRYQIWGWGYYDGHDPELSPLTWFYGDYRRVSSVD